MKLSLIAVLAVAFTGCAANPGLQSQVDNLQRETARQDREIEDLSAKAAKCNAGAVAGDLKTDATDFASAAWTWVSHEASDGASYTKSIASCYNAGRANVHSWEDGKALMETCYHNQH